MLLLLMFFVAVLAISMLAVLPRVAQQVKRDKEEEMIHRGTEYARAVKKYYKKFNKYPNSVQDLENTNQIRFLRRRYKDPMSPDGNWRLLHITDVQQGISNPNFGVSQAGNFNPTQGGPQIGPGAPVIGAAGTQGNPGGMALGGGANPQAGPVTPAAAGGGAATSTDTSGAQSEGAGTSGNATSPSTSTSSPGSPSLGGQTGQTYGAGGIVGVASASKAKSIREFDKKSNYNKWMFIYDPTQDRGTLLKGPYNPQAFQGSANNTNANGTNGQPGLTTGGAFGAVNGGQQPNQQQNGPQNNMPPDQNAPPE